MRKYCFYGIVDNKTDAIKIAKDPKIKIIIKIEDLDKISNIEIFKEFKNWLDENKLDKILSLLKLKPN